MADPRVIQNIRRAAQATGADPAALLAMSLTETGARTGPDVTGDNGTSFDWAQFHRGGALGSHSPAWAGSYDSYLNRANEFKRLGVHGGKGAAAVQRPANPTEYAAKVDANLARARELLGQHAAIAGTQQRTAAITPTAPGGVIPGESLLQSILSQNAQLAGIPEIQLPAPVATQPLATPTKPTPQQQAAKTLRPTGRVVTAKNPKLIGLPYQGTHKLYGNWESDNAVDIALPRMTPVYATANGVIGSQIGSLNSNDPHMAGERLHLKVAGNELYYQHLSKIVVQAGQRVQRGQLLGYTGALNHLHLGVQKGDPRRYA